MHFAGRNYNRTKYIVFYEKICHITLFRYAGLRFSAYSRVGVGSFRVFVGSGALSGKFLP